jgi:hypothetical protein
MGMAKLNISISAIDNPSGIDDKHQWYVTIFDCFGNVFDWCGKKYVVLPTKYGHLEVEVPPGCYYLKAVRSFSFVGGIYYVNHLTDAGIVEVSYDETVCVRLFNPGIHRYGTIFGRAINNIVQQKAKTPELVNQHKTASNAALATIPKPMKGFELDYIDEIEKLVKEQEAEQER